MVRSIKKEAPLRRQLRGTPFGLWQNLTPDISYADQRIRRRGGKSPNDFYIISQKRVFVKPELLQLLQL